MARVLVTGANRGIGLELARQYAEAGFEVLATCRSPLAAKALSDLSDACPALRIEELDVLGSGSIQSLASKLEADGLELDILINNAGVLIAEQAGEWSAEALRTTLDTNVAGPAMIIQRFAGLMASGGKVVNISSGIGSFALGIDFRGEAGVYAVSKAALNMVVRQLSAWLKARGVTMIACSPGWVRTDMGGSMADLSVQESAGALLEMIDGLALEDSGSFLDRAGDQVPW